MKAKKENIVEKKRSKLEEVLPLEMPYSVTIDPCNLCNFKCKFCALQNSKEKLGFKKEIMDFELYKKIINDIGEFPNKLKVLRLTGQGEPLLNPNYINMVKYAKEKNIADYIEVVTNGSKLNPEFNSQLANSGINRVRISIEEVDEEGYLKIAGIKINLKEFIENIEDLYNKCKGKCEIYIKIVDAVVETEEKKERFNNLFGNICDKIWIDHVIPLWSDFDEINKNFHIQNTGMHGQEIKKVEVCPFPFYSIIVNPNGEVTACCADWKRKLVLGNLTLESFKEVWNGSRIRSFWIDMLSGSKHKYEMCQKCLLPSYDCNDNIDSYAQQILERFRT